VESGLTLALGVRSKAMATTTGIVNGEVFIEAQNMRIRFFFTAQDALEIDSPQKCQLT
jgi:phage-related protein